MPSSMEELAGYDLGPRTASWNERDAILFALAVGAGADDLDLVWEERLQVLPTMAMALGLEAVWDAGRTGVYDPLETLHVGQQLRVHGPFPRKGTVEIEAAVGAVWDKGSAALVDVEAKSDLFDATYTIFIPGAGGFRENESPPAPAGQPDEAELSSFALETDARQALLYRLTGDLHPAHIDPEAAAKLGLERPILHGLCTLSATALALANEVGQPPASLIGLDVRFSAPVYPGASLEIDYSQTAEGYWFEAKVGERLALKSGTASFS